MKKQILIISFIFLLLGNSAQAVNVYFNSDNTNIKTNRFFEAGVIIDSKEESINAIEGKMYFPENLLTLVEIKENNSIISFWIEKPNIAGNFIKFSGIVPGGYVGQGNLFQAIFRAKNPGSDNLNLGDIKVLLNDGKGTEVDVDLQSISFNISDYASDSEQVIIVDLTDQDLPEPFTPMISKIPEIAGENYLLMFNTQDKGSGIDYYQVKEGFGPFIDAESPYILRNQELDKKIIVKAVDKSGNERTVTISPVYPKPWYENSAIFVIILVVIVSFILGRVSWTKTKKRK